MLVLYSTHFLSCFCVTTFTAFLAQILSVRLLDTASIIARRYLISPPFPDRMASDVEDNVSFPGTTLPEPDDKTMSSKEIIAAIDTRSDILGKTMDDLLESISHLHTMRNHHTLIHRLPSEILAEIFDILAPTFPEKMDLLTISHVCIHWRAVALENAKLWRRIPVDSGDLAWELLSRSKSVPISVIVEGRSPLPQDCIEMLTPHVGRIWSMHASTHNTSDMRTLVTRLKGFAQLRQLDLSTLNNDIISTSTAFGNVLPVLRSLSLRYISIPWTSPIYTNLTDLHLYCQLFFAASHPAFSTTTFLNMLERCPGLETLVVQECPSHAPELISATRKVDLPRLKLLRLLRIPVTALFNLLLHLSLPTTTRIDLEAPVSMQNPIPATPPHQDMFGLRGFTAYRTLEYFWEAEHLASVTIRARIETETSLDPPLFQMRLTCTPLGGLCELRPFDLSCIEVLMVGGEDCVHFEIWCMLLANMKQLRTLRLINMGTEALVSLMCGVAQIPLDYDPYILEQLDIEQRHAPFCPQLSSVEIINSQFESELRGLVNFVVRLRSWKKGGSLRSMEMLEVRGYEAADVEKLRAHGVTILFNGEEEEQSIRG